MLSEINKIHFIGIGGIGISAIARLFLLQGKTVIGSDLNRSLVTDELEKFGAKIYFGHNKNNLGADSDLVVYTIAISDKNPELIKAKKLKISVLSYPEILGQISKNFYTIAVSGTHGKTTTTAMVGKILSDTSFDPTVIVGSFLKNGSGNLIVGKSNFLVVEACEYRRSFLNLSPNILIITNIDNDHLDYYKDIKDIQSAFMEMVNKLPEDGYLICNTKQKTLKPVLKSLKAKLLDFSKIKRVPKLLVPGEHNVENAKAALCVAIALKINKQKTKKSLETFSGTWRRIEYKGKTKSGALLYDDYGHHPTEIRATLAALRGKFKKKKMFVIFQPHLYSRTKLLLKDFTKSFNNADEIIITDIYAAREKMDKTIHAKDLSEALNKNNKDAIYVSSFKDIVNYINKKSKTGDIILTIGAGSILNVAETLTNI